MLNFINITCLFAAAFFSFGTTQGARYILSSKRFIISDVFFTYFLLSIFNGLLISLGIFAAWYFGLLGESGNNLNLEIIILVLILCLSTAVSNMLTFLLTGVSKFKSINKTVLFKSILTIIFLWTLVIFLNLGLLGALIATIVASFLQVVLYLIEILKVYKIKFKFDILYIRSSFKYSIKSWFGTVTTSISQKIDQFFVGLYISAKELGIYGMAVQFADFILFIPTAADQIFFNKIADIDNAKEQKKFTERYIRLNFWFTVVFSIFFVTALYFTIPYILGEEYKDSALLFLLYSPGVIIWIVPKYITKYFAAINKPEKSSYVTILGMLLIPGILVPAIYFYGVIGIAIGASISSFITVIYCYYLFYNSLNLKYIKDLLFVNRDDINWAKNSFKGMKFKKILK